MGTREVLCGAVVLCAVFLKLLYITNVLKLFINFYPTWHVSEFVLILEKDKWSMESL